MGNCVRPRRPGAATAVPGAAPHIPSRRSAQSGAPPPDVGQPHEEIIESDADFNDWKNVVSIEFGGELTAVDLTVTLLCLSITDPSGLGAFAREFTRRTSTRRGSGARGRDVLPLPLPTLSQARRWIRSRSGPRSRRCRLALVAKAVMLECWVYMEVLGLNRTFCGRAVGSWQHDGSLTKAQQQAMEHLIARAQVFSEEPFAIVKVPALSAALSHAAVDYSGEPAVKALSCVLAELAPGLPRAEHAAALDAGDFVGPEISAWLEDPSVALKPVSE